MSATVVTSVLGGVGRSLLEGFFMFWDTLWALVLGFALSGAVQAFASRDAMRRQLGDHRPASVVRASLYGMASSSCSYAASAMARSLFARGADFLASMVFMFASTNLVVELGIVLVVLIGWQFLAAELVGGVIMIVLLVALGGLWLRGRVIDEARARVEGGAGAHEQPAVERDSWRRRARTAAGWSDAASATMGDLTMLRKELVIGFVVAGFLSELVPAGVWSAVFVHGHGFWTSLENAFVGPFVALLSFVCSVGNVPLAAALWNGGTSFGGVVAFVFADLITLPLVLVYRRQYGGGVALRMLAVFWAVMSLAGLLTEYLFRALGWVPRARHGRVVGDTVGLNATTVLDVVALAVFAGLWWLARNRERFGGGVGYAIDPVCGMQVDVAHAPASTVHDGQPVWFCSEHCMHRFVAAPSAATEPSDRGVDLATLDPVCGMTVDPATAAASVDHRGRTTSFCCTGCADTFRADPDRYLPETATDPVCGMVVDPAGAAAFRRGPSAAVWFCSVGCAERWDASQATPVTLTLGRRPSA